MKRIAIVIVVLLAVVCGLAPGNPPTVVRVQTGYNQQYPAYNYYTPYNPPRITYLLIVPAPAAPAPIPPDPVRQPETLKQPEPPKKVEALTQPEPKKQTLKEVPDDSVTPRELALDVLDVLIVHCASCHSADKAKGGLVLVNSNAGVRRLAALTKNQWWEVYGRSNAGQMPPAAATDATKALGEADLLPLLKRASLK